MSESVLPPSDASLKVWWSTTASMAAALRMAATFRPMVVFLDIGLPIMDGYELAARLRDLPELNDLRLFAVTGYGQESDRQKTRAAGFDHHFTKPINLDAIDAVLAGDMSDDHLAK